MVQNFYSFSFILLLKLEHVTRVLLRKEHLLFSFEHTCIYVCIYAYMYQCMHITFYRITHGSHNTTQLYLQSGHNTTLASTWPWHRPKLRHGHGLGFNIVFVANFILQQSWSWHGSPLTLVLARQGFTSSAWSQHTTWVASASAQARHGFRFYMELACTH